MPYKNEHSARLNDPDKYKEFRRKNNAFGDGIDAIYGIYIEAGKRKTQLQAIRFNKEKYTIAEVKKWLKEHNHKAIKIEPAQDTTEMEQAFNIGVPIQFEREGKQRIQIPIMPVNVEFDYQGRKMVFDEPFVNEIKLNLETIGKPIPVQIGTEQKDGTYHNNDTNNTQGFINFPLKYEILSNSDGSKQKYLVGYADITEPEILEKIKRKSIRFASVQLDNPYSPTLNRKAMIAKHVLLTNFPYFDKYAEMKVVNFEQISESLKTIDLEIKNNIKKENVKMEMKELQKKLDDANAKVVNLEQKISEMINKKDFQVIQAERDKFKRSIIEFEQKQFVTENENKILPAYRKGITELLTELSLEQVTDEDGGDVLNFDVPAEKGKTKKVNRVDFIKNVILAHSGKGINFDSITGNENIDGNLDTGKAAMKSAAEKRNKQSEVL